MSQNVPRVCVVIPTKNEENSIAGVIDEVRNAIEDSGYGEPLILVADDSVDGTEAIVRRAGATVLRAGGVGLGYAMAVGLREAARTECDYIVSVDGDGQADPSEIPAFLEPLESGRADLVLGSRFIEKGLVKYKYPRVNRAGVRILAWLLTFFGGQRFTDSHGGIRAMRRPVVAELALTGTHSYVQETIIDAVQRGYRVIEIPSVWRKRQHGSSRVVASIPRYAAHTLPVLLVKTGKHITWLTTAGALFALAAVAGFIAILIEESFSIPGLFDRLPALLLIALLVMVGTQMFFTGLVLEMLRNIARRVDRIDSARRD